MVVGGGGGGGGSCCFGGRDASLVTRGPGIEDPPTTIDGAACVADVSCSADRWLATKIPHTKYTCGTGQTLNKLLEQWVHLTNHAAGHSRPGTTHLTTTRVLRSENTLPPPFSQDAPCTIVLRTRIASDAPTHRALAPSLSPHNSADPAAADISSMMRMRRRSHVSESGFMLLAAPGESICADARAKPSQIKSKQKTRAWALGCAYKSPPVSVSRAPPPDRWAWTPASSR